MATVSLTLYSFTGWASSPSFISGPQSGSYSPVPADGAYAVSISFPAAYAAVLSSIVATPGESSDTAAVDELSCQIVSSTTTGFVVTVVGGKPGTTCTVYWQAEGY